MSLYNPMQSEQMETRCILKRHDNPEAEKLEAEVQSLIYKKGWAPEKSG